MAKDEVPNLNSPPGMPPPHQLPPASALAPLSTTGQNHPESPAPMQTPQVQPASERFVYYSCVAVTIGAPLVALLPPRKLDPYTFGLGLAWCASTGVVLERQTGHGLIWHVGSMIPSAANAERRARDRKQQGEDERMRRARDDAQRHGRSLVEMMRDERKDRVPQSGEAQSLEQASLVQQVQDREHVKKKGERGVIGKIWMGREGDDWIEKRAREEREALEDGKGYGGLMIDYIKDAFGIRWFDFEDDGDNDQGDEKIHDRLRKQSEETGERK